jgi:hypothetical protein
MQPSISDYWYVPANSSLDVDAKFTVEAWATYDTSSRYGIFANNTVENQFNAYISGTTVAILGLSLSGGTVQAGQWFHTAVTYDGTTYRLYVNGIQVATDATSGVRDFSGCWVFGQEVDGAGNCTTGFDANQAWDGKTDEVKIYNYTRSSSQIKADAATDVRNPILPGAPVAEWKMDEKTGSYAYDTSGNGNTGTLGGSASWTNGQVGAALKFSDATDDKVTFGSSVLNTPPYTFCAWAKPDSITDGDYHYVIANGGESGGLYGFYIYLNNTGTWAIGVKNSSGLAGSASIAASNTNWVHLCGTWDGTSSSGAVKLYVNGSLAATGTASGTESVSASNFKIGGASGTDAYNWDGKIDHVRIYNYARSPAQIAWDYNRGGPVGWWAFDECSGSTANDRSGNSNNGTITIGASGSQTSAGTCSTSGTAWYNGVTGKYNSSLNFDGTDDYVSRADQGTSDPLRLNNATGMAISLWINPTGTYGTFNGLVTKGSGNTGYILRFSGSSSINARIANGSTYEDLNLSYSFPSSSWSHLVFVFSGNGYVYYVNGINKTSGSSSLGSISGASVPLYIGSDEGVASRYFSGQIDDVKIFNYALTPLQVKQLYNQGGAIRFGPSTGAP